MTSSCEITIRCEPAERRGALVLGRGHRAICACGWYSDRYAQLSDTRRAVEVHLRSRCGGGLSSRKPSADSTP